MVTKSGGGKRRVASSQSGGNKHPQRFEDDAMIRTVLAKPLLDFIEQEREAEIFLRDKLRDAFRQDLTALRLNRDFPGGLRKASEVVRDFITEYDESNGAGPHASELRTVGRVPEVILGNLSEQLKEALIEANQRLRGPLLSVWPRSYNVIIDVNLKFETKELMRLRSDPAARRDYNAFSIDPRIKAKEAIGRYIERAIAETPNSLSVEGVSEVKTQLSNQYVFARLGAQALFQAVKMDRESAKKLCHEQQLQQAAREQVPAGDMDAVASDELRYRAIHQVWPDFQLRSCVFRSARTVKADAAQNAFSASGDGITWAVIDSGIDYRHPHFEANANIDPNQSYHADFSGEGTPLVDRYGHGTHVAGIIAGQQCVEREPKLVSSGPYTLNGRMRSAVMERKPLDELNNEFKIDPKFEKLQTIAGIAPKCKLVSLKVLDASGGGMASNVIAAIAHIQQINGHGRDLKIHGVNISLGHEFDPLWFACGHSPLCVEVNRLVKSGVVVVVAAGNTGYGTVYSDERARKAGLEMSINDPGNAELAITVGATHRDSPYRYGVSFFSSKGPTGDGRYKPDLVAPGERIISAAVPRSNRFAGYGDDFAYAEMSGTSMAAPHVSGAIAAFLSIRKEFVGEAEKIKHIFTSAASDLGRERYFQGAGMVDLLRAIQSV